ncbi:MAG TPA: hypothetical protein DHW82_02730 [Spirochaetia bacterium]|nr:MAG: hypothetical protein A2Y41_10600 [Spirochaetes bacterium GWB1_36_13]HCL55907.1 hypothetical protein [Spirochaetia bacterium]
MKINKLIQTFFFSLFFLLTLPLFAEDMLFFKIDVSEAMLFIDLENQQKLNWDATNSLKTDIAYKSNFNQDASLMILYELGYTGPGVKGTSQESFSSRSIDHSGMAKFYYNLLPELQMSVKGDFFYEFYRTGKTEKWSEGLYNFGKTGGGFNFLFTPFKESKTSLSGELHYYWFPNYNDLINEAVYLLGSASTQLDEDSLNQNFLYYTVQLREVFTPVKTFFIDLSYYFGYRDYTKMKTDDEDLDPANNQKLKDSIHNFQFEAGYFALPELLIRAAYNLTAFRSNYNYLFVQSFSPLAYSFHKDFSSFTEHQVSLTLHFFASQKSTLILSPGYEYKNYLSKSPKNADGSFNTGSNQYHKAFSIGLGWIYKRYENFTLIPEYVFKTTESNNLDLNSGYNYKVHYFGVKFIFEY